MGVRWLVVVMPALCAVGAFSATPHSPGPGLDSTFDLIWTVVEQAVKSSLAPLTAELDTRLSSMESELKSVRSEIGNVRSVLGGLQAELGSVKSETGDVGPAIAAVTSVIGSLRSELSSAVSEIASLKPELGTRASETGSLRSELSSAVSEITSLKSELGTRVSETGSLRSELTSAVSEIGSLKSELGSLRSQLGNVTSQFGSLQSDLLSRFSSLTSRPDGLRFDLSDLPHSVDSQPTSPDPDQTTAVPGSSAEADTEPVTVTQLNDTQPSGPARDCSDLPADTGSGLQQLLLQPNRSVAAYCDMETDGGGWIVIQRRDDIRPRQSFSLGWDEYKRGFGRLEQEFWWGLQNLRAVTARPGHHYQLRIDLGDFEGQRRHALYQNFSVASEKDGYQLSLSGYSGNAGDSLSVSDGAQFYTKDRDPQRFFSQHCGVSYKGGGWFSTCSTSRVNAPFLSEQTGQRWTGIFWRGWRGVAYSLKYVEMKIRRTS